MSGARLGAGDKDNDIKIDIFVPLALPLALLFNWESRITGEENIFKKKKKKEKKNFSSVCARKKIDRKKKEGAERGILASGVGSQKTSVSFSVV